VGLAAAGSVDEKNLPSCSGVVEYEAEGIFLVGTERWAPSILGDLVNIISDYLRRGVRHKRCGGVGI
jgi:hypothetical protein